MRTQVGIVGAGPAGLVAAAVLGSAGIDHVVVERRPREHIERRARAGLLEHRTVAYLASQGLAGRLMAEGRRAGWSDFRLPGHRMRLDYAALTGGYRHWVYPQQLLVRDLCDTVTAAGRAPLFSRTVQEVTGLLGPLARIVCEDLEIDCDFVIGADGHRGIARTLLPDGPAAPRPAAVRYPYGTLTMLAEVDRPAEGVLYAIGPDGFAGMMPRGPGISRFHLQVAPGDTPADWPAARIREHLTRRLGGAGTGAPRIGALTEVGPLLMRSHIAGSLRYGRLLLAGDAAHLLTPFGGKGANLAIADVAALTRALIAHYRDGDDAELDAYSEARLREIWQVQDFSDRLLRLVMLPEGDADPAERRFALGLKRTSLERITQGHDIAFAHRYVGSGLDPG